MSKIWAIVWKDIVSELRTKDIVISVLVFAFLVLVIFNFAFEPTAGLAAAVAPGILWVTFSFAGVLSMNRSVGSEKDRGSLDGLMLTPVDRDVIYFGKAAASLIFMLLVELMVLPIFFVLFNLPFQGLPMLAVVSAVGAIGFVTVGTLFSTVAVNTRAREIMLPILFFPVVSPVIISAVEASSVVLKGEALTGLAPWLPIMVSFDVIFLVVSALTFEFVLEE